MLITKVKYNNPGQSRKYLITILHWLSIKIRPWIAWEHEDTSKYSSSAYQKRFHHMKNSNGSKRTIRTSQSPDPKTEDNIFA